MYNKNAEVVETSAFYVAERGGFELLSKSGNIEISRKGVTSLIQCIQKCIQEFYYLLLSVFITWTPVSFVLRNSIIWSLYLLVTDITISLASLAKNDIDSLKLLTNATFS